MKEHVKNKMYSIDYDVLQIEFVLHGAKIGIELAYMKQNGFYII